MKTKARIVGDFSSGFWLCIIMALLLTAGGLEFAGTARATDFHRINPGGGDWSNTNNSAPSRVTPPQSGDSVNFTLAGTYAVTGDGAAGSLVLGGESNQTSSRHSIRALVSKLRRMHFLVLILALTIPYLLSLHPVKACWLDIPDWVVPKMKPSQKAWVLLAWTGLISRSLPEMLVLPATPCRIPRSLFHTNATLRKRSL